MALKFNAGTVGGAAAFSGEVRPAHVFAPIEQAPEGGGRVPAREVWKLAQSIGDLARGAHLALQIVDRDEVMLEAIRSGCPVDDAGELPLFSVADRDALFRLARAAMLCIAEKAETLTDSAKGYSQERAP